MEIQVREIFVFFLTRSESTRMAFDTFQRAITALALRRMAHLPPDQRTDALVDEFIFTNCNQPSEADPQIDQLATVEAVDVIRSYRLVLGKLYSLYTVRDTQIGTIAWSDVATAQGTMIALSYAKMMEDLDVTPDLLGRAAVQRVCYLSNRFLTNIS